MLLEHPHQYLVLVSDRKPHALRRQVGPPSAFLAVEVAGEAFPQGVDDVVQVIDGPGARAASEEP
jgi:hypothetical protein